MLLTKEVQVKLWGTNMWHYKNLGYNGKQGDIITVKVEDVPKNSHIKIDVLCDYCGEEIFSVFYYHYNNEMKYVKRHACKNCWQKKKEDVVEAKYGVKNVSCLSEVQKRREQTFINRYGVSNPLQSEEIKYKQSQTILDVYGVDNISQLDEIKQQKIQTSLEHYGVDHPSKTEEIKEKIRNTNLRKYGVPYTQQVPEVRAKSNETFCKNGTQKTSKQQLYLYSLYGGKINYAISYYAVDICLPEDKIVIEYDGGGHDLRVTLGRLTQEEFDKREIIRNVVIKREGYKQMKIISKSDLLPTDSTLLQMLSEAKQYFSETNHSWCSYDIDQGLLFNAEHKDGIPYSFGELRKIKDSDLPDTQNNTINKILKGA